MTGCALVSLSPHCLDEAWSTLQFCCIPDKWQGLGVPPCDRLEAVLSAEDERIVHHFGLFCWYIPLQWDQRACGAEKNNNKRKYAAQDLGISERTLYRKIKQYEIEE